MKIGEAEVWLRKELHQSYDEREAGNIASMIMENITGCLRLERTTKKEVPLNVQQLHRLTAYMQRMAAQEPVQYVLGEAWFCGLKLFVDNTVLIPRPETEELVEWIITDMKAANKDVFERGPSEADETKKLKILDVGTGSGCIALALKKSMPKAEVWGCDISDAALNIARRNGSELDIRVDFQGLDFLDAAQRRQLPTVDIIVSNPPYVPQRESEQMQPNVVKYEPHTALFVTDSDPLIFYKALADFGKQRLYKSGIIYAEIHENRGTEVAELFRNEGYEVELRNDMQGKERMIKVNVQ